jgi:4-amino-4-deoxy-L-arabinose transferase-like glycosyltransferase
MSDFTSRLVGSYKLTAKQFLFLVVLLNLVIKAFPASLIELGNDEVYYWTYALFPDWSHFDHPPMVGLIIRLFTLNLALHAEFFMRLGSLVLSSANVVLIFFLVKRIYSEEAARISSLLFTASVYFNVICGMFILPDTPQIFFVLLALWFGIPALTAANPTRYEASKLMLFGLFTGFAFLSKYHSLFLWLGAGLFILFHNRRWLTRPSFYVSALLTLLVMVPVIYWNISNDFISFTFHESRVGFFGSKIRPDSFLQFNLGQFFYHNPVLSVIYLLTLAALFKKGRRSLSATEWLMLYLSLPLILVFTVSSLFRDTLPHWTGPAFIGLIILSSNWLEQKARVNRKRVVNSLVAANGLVVLVFVLGILQINFGLLYPPSATEKPVELGTKDVTLDMYGWDQAGDKFRNFLTREGITEQDYSKVKIVSNNWFPAANIDFYVASPLKIDLFVSGPLDRSHKYYWINKTRKIGTGDRLFYITSSQYYNEPEKLAAKAGRIVPKDTLRIVRNQKTVKNLFIFELQDADSIIRRF